MVKIDGEKRHRIPFSQRLFWSVFFMFLGFTVCFLLFQYQREREFAQEKLNNVLSNYNYQLFRKCQQSTDINKTVISFMDDIPQKDLRVTIIDPSGDVLFDNSGRTSLITITTGARYAKPDYIMKDSLSVPRNLREKGISIRHQI